MDWLVESVLKPIKEAIEKLPWWLRFVLLCVILGLVLFREYLTPSPPQIARFSTDPKMVKPGETVAVSWEVKNARRVAIEPDIGLVTSAGTRFLAPKATTVYTLTAENWFFSESASHQVEVKTIPSPAPRPRVISFRNFMITRFLSGEEYAREGIKRMKPVVEDPSYCSGARLVLLQPREHDPPGSFLSTALSSDKLTSCNTLPIDFEFNQPVRKVTIEFRGAAVAYELNAYDSKGNLLGQSTQNAQAYSTKTYTVSFTSAARNITKITFGYTGAVTLIQQISYQ